jgi:hypothetical protein
MDIRKDNNGVVASLISSPQMMALILVSIIVLAIIFFVGITIMSFFLDFFIPIILVIVGLLILLGKIPVPYRFATGFIIMISGFMFWFVNANLQTIGQMLGVM